MREIVKGQKAKLADITSATQFDVGLSVSFTSPHVVDISCFGLDSNGRLSDDRYFIFYNQKESPCGSLAALGARDGDQERFRINLAGLPGTVRRLVLTATIDGAGTMAQISQGYVRLLVNNAEVARYHFTGSDFNDERAIIIGEFYFKDMWRFGAVGQGFNGGLKALLQHFGGEEIAAQPAPAPARPTSSPPPPPARPTPAPAPAPSPGVTISKVTLEKKGDKKAVDLRKGGGLQPLHFNLNWDNPNANKHGFLGLGGGGAAPDLDLGCMYRLKDGSQGVIQPIGGVFGARDSPPFIFLDKDDRTGAAADGENLFIYRPDLIDAVMVFALIYEGSRDFTSVNGRMTIREQTGNEIFIRLNSPDPHLTFCAICMVRRAGTTIEIVKEERYFKGHPDADQYYHFGFTWRAGSK
ncbi:MAG: TerD family protein [Chloroflexales bacterium]